MMMLKIVREKIHLQTKRKKMDPNYLKMKTRMKTMKYTKMRMMKTLRVFKMERMVMPSMIQSLLQKNLR